MVKHRTAGPTFDTAVNSAGDTLRLDPP